MIHDTRYTVHKVLYVFLRKRGEKERTGWGQPKPIHPGSTI